MIRRLVPAAIPALMLAALVAGCGADGAPTPPPGPKPAASHVTYEKDGTKVTVSGEAYVGVVKRF